VILAMRAIPLVVFIKKLRLLKLKKAVLQGD
jgi:hypothetical protein